MGRTDSFRLQKPFNARERMQFLMETKKRSDNEQWCFGKITGLMQDRKSGRSWVGLGAQLGRRL